MQSLEKKLIFLLCLLIALTITNIECVLVPRNNTHKSIMESIPILSKLSKQEFKVFLQRAKANIDIFTLLNYEKINGIMITCLVTVNSAFNHGNGNNNRLELHIFDDAFQRPIAGEIITVKNVYSKSIVAVKTDYKGRTYVDSGSGSIAMLSNKPRVNCNNGYIYVIDKVLSPTLDFASKVLGVKELWNHGDIIRRLQLHSRQFEGQPITHPNHLDAIFHFVADKKLTIFMDKFPSIVDAFQDEGKALRSYMSNMIFLAKSLFTSDFSTHQYRGLLGNPLYINVSPCRTKLYFNGYPIIAHDILFKHGVIHVYDNSSKSANLNN